jgi:hypothetical protein
MTRAAVSEDAMFRTVTAAVVAALVTVTPAFAADRPAANDAAGATANADAAATVYFDSSLPAVKFGAETRGAVLPSLYVSLAGLNALDAYTTSKGLALGAAEGNPLMRGVASSPAMLWAVKGGVTAGSVFLAERMWRKNNKVGAIAVMAVSNGMMAVVAARNASVIRTLR